MELAYAVIASVVGVSCAVFLSYRAQRSLLKQQFKKSIYDEAVLAVQAADKALSLAAASLRGWPAIANQLQRLSDELPAKTAEQDAAALVRDMEANRSDYAHELRTRVDEAGHAFAALTRKIATYSFALPAISKQYEATVISYDTYLTDANKSIAQLLSIDLNQGIKGGDRAALDELLVELDRQAAAIMDSYEHLQMQLRKELLGDLFTG
jgi:hypothetical protein